jgi:nucleolar GTP-binding protein
MVVYNFKGITVVPTAKDFLDIVLSKTQRKTPTEIHKNYAISRIRAFYMRKVRFTQQNYHDKLSQMLTEFPLLDDIHPFYAELINILYDRDHYKLALGQINTAKHLIDNLAKDHVRLLKYGDSLYRCKQLKRAGMGRMCTLVRKLAPSLAYLEQVRQHLARLPSIDPTSRTIIVCGYPNVGKSSFMNKVTRANVEVQPYAFTTKALYVGHTDYKYITWQVIDTPGILDHPLDERNTIEMQSITAMAHLQAAILFVLDISEQCGYTIKQQVALFHSIKPLFVGKPLLVAINKIDVLRPDQVDPADMALIEALADPGKGGMSGVLIVPMSTLTEEGVTNVKNAACDALLEARVEKKLKANRITGTLNRLHVAMPVARDNKDRPAVPAPIEDESSMEDVQEEPARQRGDKDEVTWDRMQRQYEQRLRQEADEAEMWARGEVPNMNTVTWQKRYMLKNADERFDKIPELLDGKNIADFVDPDIEELLEELEREEDERIEKLEEYNANKDADSDLDEDEMRILNAIRNKKLLLQKEHVLGKNRGRISTFETKNRDQTYDQLEDHLKKRGFDEEQAKETVTGIRESRSQSRLGRKRERTASRSRNPEEEGMTELQVKKARRESRSKSRLASMTPKPGSGMKDLKDVLKAQDIQRASIKDRNKDARRGESDRHIASKMPKHLFSGKRGIGKTDRR